MSPVVRTLDLFLVRKPVCSGVTHVNWKRTGGKEVKQRKNQNPKLNNKTQNSKERKKNQNHFYLYEKQIAVCA